MDDLITVSTLTKRDTYSPTCSNLNRLFAAERGRAGFVGNTGSSGRLYSAETAETVKSLPACDIPCHVYLELDETRRTRFEALSFDWSFFIACFAHCCEIHIVAERKLRDAFRTPAYKMFFFLSHASLVLISKAID